MKGMDANGSFIDDGDKISNKNLKLKRQKLLKEIRNDVTSSLCTQQCFEITKCKNNDLFQESLFHKGEKSNELSNNSMKENLKIRRYNQRQVWTKKFDEDKFLCANPKISSECEVKKKFIISLVNKNEKERSNMAQSLLKLKRIAGLVFSENSQTPWTSSTSMSTVHTLSKKKSRDIKEEQLNDSEVDEFAEISFDSENLSD
jgi:hypothetical protein